MRVLYSQPTHQELARLAIKLLLLRYPGEFAELGSLNGQQLVLSPLGQKIEQAVYDEDCCGNFVNHFRHGVTGDKLGIGQFDALTWAHGGGAAIFNPYSWEFALQSYNHGLKSEAYEALGHVLHLLQDMAQPGHTHLDPHPAGAYEKKVHEHVAEWIPTFSELQLLTPIMFSSLDVTFSEVARLSYDANRFSYDDLRSMFSLQILVDKWELWNKSDFSGILVLHEFAGKKAADNIKDLGDDFWETRSEDSTGNADVPGFYYIENPDKAVPEFYPSVLSAQNKQNPPLGQHF